MLKNFDNDELLLWKWQIIQNLKWKFKCNVVCSWKCDQMLKSKVAQFFQKLPKRQSQQKCVFFKISLQKVSKYLGYFCKKKCRKELSKLPILVALTSGRKKGRDGLSKFCTRLKNEQIFAYFTACEILKRLWWKQFLKHIFWVFISQQHIRCDRSRIYPLLRKSFFKMFAPIFCRCLFIPSRFSSKLFWAVPYLNYLVLAF